MWCFGCKPQPQVIQQPDKSSPAVRSTPQKELTQVAFAIPIRTGVPLEIDLKTGVSTPMFEPALWKKLSAGMKNSILGPISAISASRTGRVAVAVQDGIFLLRRRGAGKYEVERFIPEDKKSPFTNPLLSPDGNFLAYANNMTILSAQVMPVMYADLRVRDLTTGLDKRVASKVVLSFIETWLWVNDSRSLLILQTSDNPTLENFPMDWKRISLDGAVQSVPMPAVETRLSLDGSSYLGLIYNSEDGSTAFWGQSPDGTPTRAIWGPDLDSVLALWESGEVVTRVIADRPLRTLLQKFNTAAPANRKTVFTFPEEFEPLKIVCAEFE